MAADGFVPLSAHRTGERAVPIAERTAEERGPSKLLRWKQTRSLALRQAAMDSGVQYQAPADQTQLKASTEPALIAPQSEESEHVSANKRGATRKTLSSRARLRSNILQVSATESEDPFHDPFGDKNSKRPERTAQLEQPGGGFELEEPSTQPTEQVTETPSLDPAQTEAPPATEPPATEPPALESPPAETQATPPDDTLQTPADSSDESLPSPSDETARTDAEAKACEDEKEECQKAMQAIRSRGISTISLDLSISGTEGKDFPCECAPRDQEFQGRMWAPTCYTWKASGLCHKPLYFEEVALERYGHSMTPLAQDVASAAHFFATLPVLPYAMALCPPDECQYALGYYRPGNCAPYLIDPIPLNLRAGLTEAGVVAAAIILIP